MSGPLVHRLLNDQRRINEYLADYLDIIKFPVSLIRVWDIFWKGNDSHLCSSPDLPVNIRVTAGNIFLDMPVNSPYKMCEVFNSFIECPVRPFIKAITL